MNRKSLIAMAAVTLLFGFATSAAAYSISDFTAKVQSAFTGSANTSVDDTATVNVGASADVGATGSGQTGSGTSGNASGGVRANVGAEGEGQFCTMDAKMCPDGSYVGRTGPNCEFAQCPGNGASTDTTVDGDTRVSVGAAGLNVVLVKRADVNSKAVVATNGNAANVETDADLSGYIAAEMQSDENVEEVQASGDNVSVTYKTTARLFGIIPANIKTTATVDATGDVSVSYPWYSFVFAKADAAADLEARIESRVRALVNASGNAAFNAGANLGGSASATGTGQASANATATAQANANANAAFNATTEFSAETKAMLIAEMRAAMKEAAEAAASVNANAEANANANANTNIR